MQNNYYIENINNCIKTQNNDNKNYYKTLFSFLNRFQQTTNNGNKNNNKNTVSNINNNNNNMLFYLTMRANSVLNFAEQKNGNFEIFKNSAVEEGSTDCANCPQGFFTSKQCTTTSDRTCKKCSTCKQGFFMQENCTENFDTSCQVCSTCKYGKYISKKCSNELYKQDNVCENCVSCRDMQYSSTECYLGFNTVCESCEQCSFTSEKAKQTCENFSTYISWYNKNCCVDENKQKIDCDEYVSREIFLTSINGHHEQILNKKYISH